MGEALRIIKIKIPSKQFYEISLVIGISIQNFMIFDDLCVFDLILVCQDLHFYSHKICQWKSGPHNVVLLGQG